MTRITSRHAPELDPDKPYPPPKECFGTPVAVIHCECVECYQGTPLYACSCVSYCGQQRLTAAEQLCSEHVAGDMHHENGCAIETKRDLHHHRSSCDGDCGDFTTVACLVVRCGRCR